MYRVGYLFYLAAAGEFTRESQAAGALLAVGLLGWALVVELLASRADWQAPDLDTSGYGQSFSGRSVEFLTNLDRLAYYSRALRVGFALFGPLLFAWALLL